MTTLYKATYFALNHQGNEEWNTTKYFTEKGLAVEWLKKTTEDDARKSARIYPELDIYTHLEIFHEENGTFRYTESGIYSAITDGGKDIKIYGNMPLFNL